MKYYNIKFYDSDGGGMRDDLTREVNFKGTLDEAIAEVENTHSPWGFMYTVSENPGHGRAVIKQINEDIYKTEIELKLLQDKLDQLYWELGRKW